MQYNRKIAILFATALLFTAAAGARASMISEETIGAYVRAADYVIFGDLTIDSISAEKIITGKLTVTEMLKGDLGKKETAVSIDMRNPNNYKKLSSDLNLLGISAKEDIEATGASLKQVIVMMRDEGSGYDFLRVIVFFRPDKLDLYLYSYKEIVSMTKISDDKELLKTIRYNLGEEFTYSLYNHCIDELFKMDISFSALFSTVREFLDYKGERKVYTWFMILRKTAKRFEKIYDTLDDKTRDEFFSYIHDTYVGVLLQDENANKRFLDLLYDFRRLIIKNEKWKKKFFDTVKGREILVDGLEADHYRNIDLNTKREKVMRSLSR